MGERRGRARCPRAYAYGGAFRRYAERPRDRGEYEKTSETQILVEGVYHPFVVRTFISCRRRCFFHFEDDLSRNVSCLAFLYFCYTCRGNSRHGVFFHVVFKFVEAVCSQSDYLGLCGISTLKLLPACRRVYLHNRRCHAVACNTLVYIQVNSNKKVVIYF